MSQVIVGRWGNNLAIRMPLEITQKIGLSDGERVEIEIRGGELVIRRPAFEARADAQTAAEEIIAESAAYPLEGAMIRDLLEEGRRG